MRQGSANAARGVNTGIGALAIRFGRTAPQGRFNEAARLFVVSAPATGSPDPLTTLRK
jgi:hypothetical protein